MQVGDLAQRTAHFYTVKNPIKALLRDLNYLINLGAVHIDRETQGTVWLRVNLQWPTQITETEFFRLVKTMPKGKVHGFLSY
jgi:hypothetical protein